MILISIFTVLRFAIYIITFTVFLDSLKDVHSWMEATAGEETEQNEDWN